MANGIIGKVTAGGGTHLVTSTFYGTCTTAANVAAKIVKLADATPDSATLITGMLLAVKFTNANSVANPTLTVQRNANTTNLIAAKPIMVYGSTAAGTASGTAWRAGAVILFIYDGTNWVITDYNDYSIHQNAAITTNGNFNILGGNAANDDEQIGSVNKLSGLTYNPSTNVLINTGATDKVGQIYLNSPSFSYGFLNGSGGTNHGIYDAKASKWVLMGNASHQWVGNFNANGGLYLSCSTAAGTQKKTISYSPFNLQVGSSVYVTFTATNTNANPTLNINGTGDIAMYYKGVQIIYQGLATGFVYHFIYDGTHWQLINKLSLPYATCTSNANANKAVTCNGFILYTGATIDILFTKENSVAQPTLNINSTGAKPIIWLGKGIGTNSRNEKIDNISYKNMRANRVYRFVYDGANYRLLDDTFGHEVVSGITAKAAVTYTQEEYDQYVADNGTAPSWNVGDIKTAAVAAVTGYERLEIGNQITSNNNGGMTGEIWMWGAGTSKHIIKSALTGGTNRTIYIPNYAGDGYLTHTAAATAVGSATEPVYVAANGRVTTTGKTLAYSVNAETTKATQWGIAYYSTTNKITSTAAGTSGQYLKSAGAAAPVWASFVKPTVTWTDGTTVGPTLKVTTDGGASDAKTIPSASGSVSGVVTTGAQTFAGIKTFTNEVKMTAGGTSDICSGVEAAFKANRAQITNLITHNIYTDGTNSTTPITFYKYGAVTDKAPATLTQLAKIDTSGNIYEGTTKLSDKYLKLAGGTLTGALTLSADPTANLHAATKQYVDNIIATNDAMVFKGTLNGAATTTYTPAANRGWTYKVAAGGLINGERVEVGDILICTTDNTAAATSSNVSTVKANWVIVQNNVDGAVFKSTNTFTDGQVLVADGTAGKIKTSGYTIAKSVPSDAVFTDTNYYHTTGSWNGLTYTATANGGAGALAFTIPTGTTATTVALGNHEHTIYPKWQTTTKKSTELYDYGFYVSQNAAAGTGPTAGNYFTIFNVPYRKASGNTKADYGWQIGGSTSNDGRLFYRTTGNNVFGNWQEIAHGAVGTAVGSATQPVYMSNTGVITAGTALKALAYKDSLTKSDVGLGNVKNQAITVTSTSVSDGTNTFSKYTHPSHTAHSAGLYKVTIDALGHVTAATAVAKADITGLGIPGSDTDTKNTAGSTNSDSKLFLIGATSQAANPQTYSDSQVYTTNGQLDANKVRIAENVTLTYNSTTQSLDFIFA